ncbi:MAG: hypothetical protein HYZ28_02410 [Myxococcales bacterium]|nr:hypothetical protein [Myxococcales bacterium]
MIRKFAIALTVALAVPSVALACEAHRGKNAAKENAEKVQYAQAGSAAPADAKPEEKAAAQVAPTGTNAPAPAAKKAKPKAKALSTPKAAEAAK